MDEPKKPDTGSVFIVFRDEQSVGWAKAGTAWEALRLAFHKPENPRYRALPWEHCRFSQCHEALEEGRIEGKIVEGCDCLDSQRSRQRIEELERQLEALKREPSKPEATSVRRKRESSPRIRVR